MMPRKLKTSPTASLADLPEPPAGKAGWPWTEESNPWAVNDSTKRELPTVSIITPSYNQAGYIEETIRSVLLQRYPCLEYIVLDGGSTDGTVEILRKYEPWLTHWESKRDAGQADAINRGLAMSQGMVMGCLNSDDVYARNGFYKLLAAAANRQAASANEPVWYIGAGANIDPDGALVQSIFPLSRSRLERETRFTDPILQPAVFWNRAFWELIGPFDANLCYAFDWDFWLRAIAKHASPIVIPEFLAFAHMHGEQKTQHGLAHRVDELVLVLLRNCEDDPRYRQLVHWVDRIRRASKWNTSPGLRIRFRGLVAMLLHRYFREFSKHEIMLLLLILEA